MPPHTLQGLLKSFAATVGVAPEVTHTVEKLTGAPARPFARRAEDHTHDVHA